MSQFDTAKKPSEGGFRLGLLDFGILGTSDSPKRVVEAMIRRAMLADGLGFSRYWLGEHYASGCAWTDPTPLLELVAHNTQRIRIGAGGVLIAHHEPDRVAADYLKLAARFPSRIDLGIARGAAPQGACVPRSPLNWSEATYESRTVSVLNQLNALASPERWPTIWLLGSHFVTGALAGKLGMRYCKSVLHSEGKRGVDCNEYVEQFRPSGFLKEPRFALALAGICATSDKRAQSLLAGHYNSWIIPLAVGKPLECARICKRIAESAGTRELIFLDLANDEAARHSSLYQLQRMVRIMNERADGEHFAAFDGNAGATMSRGDDS